MKRAERSPTAEELNRSLCTEALVFAMEDIGRFSEILEKNATGGNLWAISAGW